MTLDNDTVNPQVQTARGRMLVFLVGAAVLPWLGASLTMLAFTWATEGVGSTTSTARDLIWVQFLLVPVIVFGGLTPFVLARDTARLRPVFAQFWAVGVLVAVVSAVITTVYAVVLDPSYGFAVASVGGMFTGYWLYAFFAGALLWRWSAPAKNSAVVCANLP